VVSVGLAVAGASDLGKAWNCVARCRFRTISSFTACLIWIMRHRRSRSRAVVDELARRLVPDELWELVETLIPPVKPRPQGGGRSRVDDRAVFTAIVFVLTSGCAWRHLPPSFGVTVPTAHRRFTQWTQAGLWWRLHHAALDELNSQGLIDWSRAVVAGACIRMRNGTR
jgi:transposase